MVTERDFWSKVSLNWDFFAAFPNNVFLNRGNHEARRMNEKYKFEDQIRQRYDSEIFELIQDTFKLLPLAATIEDKVFILHGTAVKAGTLNSTALILLKYRWPIQLQGRHYQRDPKVSF